MAWIEQPSVVGRPRFFSWSHRPSEHVDQSLIHAHKNSIVVELRFFEANQCWQCCTSPNSAGNDLQFPKKTKRFLWKWGNNVTSSRHWSQKLTSAADKKDMDLFSKMWSENKVKWIWNNKQIKYMCSQGYDSSIQHILFKQQNGMWSTMDWSFMRKKN